MISDLLKPEVQDFILANEHTSIATLALKYDTFAGVPIEQILWQIHGRSKARKKLPLWYNTEGIIYPPPLSMEQCSAAPVAAYRATLFGQYIIAADLTGGFGVDCYYLSKNVVEMHYVEQDELLAEIASHNFSCLGADNIIVHRESAEAYLASIAYSAVMYIDPARRQGGKKVFKHADCSPDIIDIMQNYLPKLDKVWLKASPFMDIKQSCEELKRVGKVYVIALQNECKEVLYEILPQDNDAGPIETVTYNLGEEAQQFAFHTSENVFQPQMLSTIQQYLYEPNAAVLKSGGFYALCRRYGVFKLHSNSHLYTTDALVTDFPGRKFIVDRIEKMNRKAVQAIIPSMKANIAVRNFPLTVAQIRRKLKVSDGGQHYVFATTDMHEKLVLVFCKKL